MDSVASAGSALRKKIHRAEQQRRVRNQRADRPGGAYQRKPPHDLHGVVLEAVGQGRQVRLRLHRGVRKRGCPQRRAVVYAGIGIVVRNGRGHATYRRADGGRNQRRPGNAAQRVIEARVPFGGEAMLAHQMQEICFVGQKGEHGFEGLLAGIEQHVLPVKRLPVRLRHGKAQARGPRCRRQSPLRRLRGLRRPGQRGQDHQHARSQHRAHPLCRQ